MEAYRGNKQDVFNQKQFSSINSDCSYYGGWILIADEYTEIAHLPPLLHILTIAVPGAFFTLQYSCYSKMNS